jgi:hypothetical protein
MTGDLLDMSLPAHLGKASRQGLPFLKVHLVPNPHPLQVDPGISFLGTLEGLSFVCGLPFPDKPLVSSWPGLSRWARNGLDIAAPS